MKNLIFLLLLAPISLLGQSHVGININVPTATLHILGEENDLNAASLKIYTPSPPLLDNTMFIDGNEIDVTGIASSTLWLQSNSSGGISMVNAGGNVGVGGIPPGGRRMTVTGLAIPEEGDIETLKGTFSILNTDQNLNEMLFDGNEIHTVDNTLFINSKSQHNVIIASGGGSVAIGTPTLATGYRLSVDGGIIGEEVRVQFTAAWPDYVFAEDYKLQSLENLAAAIKNHSRLPGMPSAAEVESNGIELGKMQGKIVEKLEELTLYIIQLNNRIKKLEVENRVLNLNAKTQQ